MVGGWLAPNKNSNNIHFVKTKYKRGETPIYINKSSHQLAVWKLDYYTNHVEPYLWARFNNISRQNNHLGPQYKQSHK